MPIPLPNLDDRTYADLTAAGPGAAPEPASGLDRLQPQRPGHHPDRAAGLADRDAAVPGQPDPAGQHREVPQAAQRAGLVPAGRREPGRRDPGRPCSGCGSATAPSPPATTSGWRCIPGRGPPRPARCRRGRRRSARVRCVPRRDLSRHRPGRARGAEAQAHVSLVVRGARAGAAPAGAPPARRRQRDCTRRCGRSSTSAGILTTRHHVVGPGLRAGRRSRRTWPCARTRRRSGRSAPPATALAAVLRPAAPAVPRAAGWPFGRAVYAVRGRPRCSRAGPGARLRGERAGHLARQAGRVQTDDDRPGVARRCSTRTSWCGWRRPPGRLRRRSATSYQ